MRMFSSFLLCLFLASFVFSQSPTPTKFSIKSEKPKYTACRLVKVTAEGGGKTVLWRFEGDLNDTEVDGKTFRFVASSKNSNIVIKAYTASVDGDVLEAILILEPDVPPIPPPPSDPLVLELRKMTNVADTPKLKKLAALYKLMIDECSKSEYSTATDINNIYRQSASNLVGDDLLNVRSLLAEQIGKVVADPDVALTPKIREDLASVFTKLNKVCLEVY